MVIGASLAYPDGGRDTNHESMYAKTVKQVLEYTKCGGGDFKFPKYDNVSIGPVVECQLKMNSVQGTKGFDGSNLCSSDLYRSAIRIG